MENRKEGGRGRTRHLPKGGGRGNGSVDRVNCSGVVGVGIGMGYTEGLGLGFGGWR